MNKKGIVDRFEGDFVIIEIHGHTKDIHKNDVSDHVKAGDVVVLIDGKWETDESQTRLREKQIKNLMDDVWED